MLEQQLACENTRRLAPYTQTLLGPVKGAIAIIDRAPPV